MITRIVLAACVVCAVTLPAAAVDSETMRYLVNCSADQGGQARVDACTGLLDGRALPPSVKPLYIYENRAAAYEDIGRLDEARRDLDRGVDLAGPEDKFGALYSRGLFLSSMTADRDAALADLSAAIALDPNQARVYMQRGNTYRLMKRYDEAGVSWLNTATAGAIQVDAPPDRPPYVADTWRQRQSRYWRE